MKMEHIVEHVQLVTINKHFHIVLVETHVLNVEQHKQQYANIIGL